VKSCAKRKPARRFPRASIPPLADSKKTRNKAQWPLYAQMATVGSCFLTCLVLGSGAYQFKETTNAQIEALSLQRQAVRADRSSKASALLEQYLAIANKQSFGLSRNDAFVFQMSRDNSALLLLNAIYSIAKGDPDWEQVVVSSLRGYRSTAMQRQIACANFSREFRELVDIHLGSMSKLSICVDWIDAEW
jgi:hypothetical protein